MKTVLNLMLGILVVLKVNDVNAGRDPYTHIVCATNKDLSIVHNLSDTQPPALYAMDAQIEADQLVLDLIAGIERPDVSPVLMKVAKCYQLASGKKTPPVINTLSANGWHLSINDAKLAAGFANRVKFNTVQGIELSKPYGLTRYYCDETNAKEFMPQVYKCFAGAALKYVSFHKCDLDTRSVDWLIEFINLTESIGELRLSSNYLNYFDLENILHACMAKIKTGECMVVQIYNNNISYDERKKLNKIVEGTLIKII